MEVILTKNRSISLILKNIAQAFKQDEKEDVRDDFNSLIARKNTIAKIMDNEERLSMEYQFYGYILKGLSLSVITKIENKLVSVTREDAFGDFIGLFTTISDLNISNEDEAKKYGINLDQAQKGMSTANFLKTVTKGSKTNDNKQVTISIPATDVDVIVSNLAAIKKSVNTYTAFSSLNTIIDEDYLLLREKLGIQFTIPDTNKPKGLNITFSHSISSRVVTFKVTSETVTSPIPVNIVLDNFNNIEYTDVITIIETLSTLTETTLSEADFKKEVLTNAPISYLYSKLGVEYYPPSFPIGLKIVVDHVANSADITFTVTSTSIYPPQKISPTITLWTAGAQARLHRIASLLASVSTTYLTQSEFRQTELAPSSLKITQEILNKLQIVDPSGNYIYQLPTIETIKGFSAKYTHKDNDDHFTITFSGQKPDGTPLTDAIGTANITNFGS